MRDLSRPDVMEAGAIKRISTSPDGEVFKRYLLKELSISDEDNRVLDEDRSLARGQGKALTIKAILDVLEAHKQQK